MMIDWVIANHTDEHLIGTWVYYISPNFPGIHFSRSVDDPNRDHMATNDGAYYYFGVTRTFNTPTTPLETQLALIAAWRDYFTVFA
jgi:hypothetical protein